MSDIHPITLLAMDACEKLKKAEPDHELVEIGSLEYPKDKYNNLFWSREDPWYNCDPSYVARVSDFNYFCAVRKYLKEKHSIKI